MARFRAIMQGGSTSPKGWGGKVEVYLWANEADEDRYRVCVHDKLGDRKRKPIEGKF